MYRVEVKWANWTMTWDCATESDAIERARITAGSGCLTRMKSGRVKLVLPRNIKSITIIPPKQ